MSSTRPMVGIVVVNYFGGERTTRCLESLEKLTWPGDLCAVCLVDNGSDPEWLDDVRGRFPSVRVVAAGKNVGFGAACNLGFAQLTDCSYVALVNNDALPAPDWLEPLVAALSTNAMVGAATPKVLLDGTFVGLEIRARTFRPGGSDPRRLGVQLCGARVDGVDVSDRIELVSGFWGWEQDATTVGGAFTWTAPEASFRVPAPEGAAADVQVRLACGNGDTRATISDGDRVVEVTVGVRPEWHDLGRCGPPHAIVNNTGTVLLADGNVVDRGDGTPDDGRFKKAGEVFGWSGAAVVLARRYIDDLGGFDPHFFLYYEDADLSWRGRLRGWTYRYEPASVVVHEHSATVGSRSPLAHHLVDRNRLLMLTKCAPRRMVGKALVHLTSDVASAIWRDVVCRLALGRRPVTRHLKARVHVAAGYVRLAPSALVGRRAIRRRATVSDDAVLAFAQETGRPQLRVGRGPSGARVRRAGSEVVE